MCTVPRTAPLNNNIIFGHVAGRFSFAALNRQHIAAQSAALQMNAGGSTNTRVRVLMYTECIAWPIYRSGVGWQAGLMAAIKNYKVVWNIVHDSSSGIKT